MPVTRFAALIIGVALAMPVHAEDESSRAGHGHVSVGLQIIHIDGFEGSGGTIPIGTGDTQSLNFEIDYNLTDRLSVFAGIPFIRKRYKGGFPHDPLLLDPPRSNVENVDTGSWNTDFQDFHLGMRYLLREGLFSVEPHIALGVPSRDYPFFGHAAVGQQLLKFDVGTTLSWYPGLSDAYYRLDVAYVFVEETLGVDVSHWRISGEAGYFFSRELTGRLFMQLKDGGGLTFPDDFPPPRTTELWYQHDRLVKHNYLNVGVGLDWSLGSRMSLNSSVMTMVWAEQVHDMQYSITFGLSRSF